MMLSVLIVNVLTNVSTKLERTLLASILNKIDFSDSENTKASSGIVRPVFAKNFGSSAFLVGQTANQVYPCKSNTNLWNNDSVLKKP